MARLSGLQKDVLALYRSILRQAVHKDRTSFLPPDNKSKGAASLLHYPPVNKLLSTSSSSTAYARDKFRKEALVVKRSDFKTIEYKIRKGKKQLELLKMPGVNVVGGTSS